MKNENIILILTLFLIFSCKTKSYKTELLGKWNYIEQPEFNLIFTKDTLFINSSIPTKQNWKIDKKNIYLQNMINNINEIKILEGEGYTNHFLYTLSINKDTLKWKAKKDSTNNYFKFFRAKIND